MLKSAPGTRRERICSVLRQLRPSLVQRVSVFQARLTGSASSAPRCHTRPALAEFHAEALLAATLALPFFVTRLLSPRLLFGWASF